MNIDNNNIHAHEQKRATAARPNGKQTTNFHIGFFLHFGFFIGHVTFKIANEHIICVQFVIVQSNRNSNEPATTKLHEKVSCASGISI